LIYLDTHVVVWLYAGELDRLSEQARIMIEAEDLAVSPIVALELQYLRESGRLSAEPCLLLDALKAEIGLIVSQRPFEAVVLEAMTQTWTRDPFDRIIVAEANLGKSVLLTKDRAILENCGFAQW
jgi:PIN domain nuclease of toxin-antitoxin system